MVVSVGRKKSSRLAKSLPLNTLLIIVNLQSASSYIPLWQPITSKISIQTRLFHRKSYNLYRFVVRYPITCYICTRLSWSISTSKENIDHSLSISLIAGNSIEILNVFKISMRSRGLSFFRSRDLYATCILRSTVSEDYQRLSSPRQCRSYLSDDPWNFCLWIRENGNNDCCLFAMLDLCTCDCCRRGHNYGTRAIDKTAIRNWPLPPISRCRSATAVKRSSPYLPDDLASRADSYCTCNNLHIDFILSSDVS